MLFDFLYVTFGGRSKGQYVHKIVVVRGKPFYGFDPLQRVFFKVFVYDPGLGMIH